MAHKRILTFAALVAICYLIGVTWAETAQNTNISSSSSVNITVAGTANAPVAAAGISTTVQNNTSQTTTTVKSASVSTTAAPKIVTAAAAPVQNKTTAPKCVCDGALLPRLAENGKQLEICAECKCQHEAHNTTLIKVVVIIVIWIISILVIYMLFLMCLDPLLNKRVKANYQEHTNEDDDPTSTTPPFPSTANQELNSRANVLNRVGHQTDKWKRQVREQRRHIYDRRTMLN